MLWFYLIALNPPVAIIKSDALEMGAHFVMDTSVNDVISAEILALTLVVFFACLILLAFAFTLLIHFVGTVHLQQHTGSEHRRYTV